MNNKVIIDTSAWIEYFRNGKGKYPDLVEHLIDSYCAVVTGPIIAELIHGVGNTREGNLIKDLLSSLPYESCNYEDWIGAGELAYALRKKGKAVPMTDILISFIAINRDMPVLTKDEHFAMIPGVKRYPA